MATQPSSRAMTHERRINFRRHVPRMNCDFEFAHDRNSSYPQECIGVGRVERFRASEQRRAKSPAANVLDGNVHVQRWHVDRRRLRPPTHETPRFQAGNPPDPDNRLALNNEKTLNLVSDEEMVAAGHAWMHCQQESLPAATAPDCLKQCSARIGIQFRGPWPRARIRRCPVSC